MRYVKFIALSLLLSGCGTMSAGTFGSFQRWTFNATEGRINQEMADFYKDNPNYLIPSKWTELDDWKERRYEFLNGKIIYFSESPEELYYISYSEIEPNSFGNDSDLTITTLSVRAVNNGDGRWNKAEDFEKNKAEEQRINSRFYNEIISKLEKQIGQKARKEDA